ncbi:MAG: hypothetical protein AB1465_02450 [Patescibacteria group bacterium]
MSTPEISVTVESHSVSDFVLLEYVAFHIRKNSRAYLCPEHKVRIIGWKITGLRIEKVYDEIERREYLPMHITRLYLDAVNKIRELGGTIVSFTNIDEDEKEAEIRLATRSEVASACLGAISV